MGLKGVPGLNYSKPIENTSGHSGASSRTANKNSIKRGIEDDHDSGVRPSRRTAHQGLPGTIENRDKPDADTGRLGQQPGRGGGRAKKPKRRVPNQ